MMKSIWNKKEKESTYNGFVYVDFDPSGTLEGSNAEATGVLEKILAK